MFGQSPPSWGVASHTVHFLWASLHCFPVKSYLSVFSLLRELFFDKEQQGVKIAEYMHLKLLVWIQSICTFPQGFQRTSPVGEFHSVWPFHDAQITFQSINYFACTLGWLFQLIFFYNWHKVDNIEGERDGFYLLFMVFLTGGGAQSCSYCLF